MALKLEVATSLVLLNSPLVNCKAHPPEAVPYQSDLHIPRKRALELLFLFLFICAVVEAAVAALETTAC